ncbi:MAG: hypothetical protein IZT58_09475 [Actinobacteria bacterium]|nr:hypothetical protein [Actinomycetota bacterium]
MIDDTERWFQGRGLPYASPHDANPLVLFSRAIPLLVLTLVAEAITLLFSDAYDGAMLWGVFLLAVLALVVLLILVRGGRPRRTWRLPAWLAGIVTIAFVFGPSAIVLAFEGRDSLVVNLLFVNVGVLVVAMLLEYYNILPIVRHEIDEIRTGQRQMLAPMRQVLPILLLAVLFLFMTAEVWQVAHDATPLGFTIVVVSLLVLSAAVVAARAQDALAGAATFTNWEQIHEVAESTAAPDLPLAGDPPEPPDLSSDSVGRGEVRLLLFVTMTVQLFIVAAMVTVVLATVGALVVRQESIVQWTKLEDADWDPIVALTIAGNEYPITKETLLMAALLGVFAAMQFAVSIMTAAALQTTYFAGVHDDAREVFAVRARYTQYLSEQGGARE